MFTLTHQVVEDHIVTHDESGGVVCFLGMVRNQSGGREVLKLEYEAYTELALIEGQSVLDEAVQKFGLKSASAVHRLGVLTVGETAVSVRVWAEHRREAFAGCEWIIDELKSRVPIWKKEHYVDGESEWIGAGANATMFPADDFSRQTVLEEVGPAGQEILLSTRVLLVGVGGLGSTVLPYLVGAGIGTVGLVDGDQVDATNLHRQVIFGAQDVGCSKVERASVFAKRLRPSVKVETYDVRIGVANVDTLVGSFDWIVDGTDSLEVKSLLNSACKRNRKPLVTAAVHKFEGQVLTVLPDGPCLRCLFPDWPDSGSVRSCDDNGVMGVVPGLMGLWQANEVIKGILGLGDDLSRHVLLVDLLSNNSTLLERFARKECPGCAGEDVDEGDIEVSDIREAEALFGECLIVDIREVGEKPSIERPHRKLPLSEFVDAAWKGPAVIVCASGTRSKALVRQLRGLGRSDVVSLRGGVSSLEPT